MTETSSGGLHSCITDIVRADTSGDYQKALQAANKMIRRYPKETYAFKCKLVALIQLSMWDDALTLIKKTPHHQMGDCAFEKAYIYYRQGELDQAEEQLATCDKEDFRALELKAQIYYKQEKFQEAFDIFRHLLKNFSDDSDELRRANYLAVQTRLEAQGSKQQLEETGEETYSQLYNKACVQIEAELLPQALISLDKALVACRKSLTEEGRDEDEIEEELDSIRVQKAYILQRTGKRQQAIDIYKKVQASNHGDESVIATVVNNIPAASNDFSLPEARKKLKAALQVDQSKLTKRQRRTLMLNNALVLLLSNQREPCKRALDELVEKFGASKDVSLIEAALHVRLNDTEKALSVLDGNDVEQQLVRIHVLVNAGRLDEAVKALGSIPKELSAKPAVASLRTSLLVALDNKAEAIKELTSAIEKTNDPEVLKKLLEQAAQLETSVGNVQGAAKLLERLVGLFSDDINAKCLLISAYSVVDPKKAEKLSENLFNDKSDTNMNVDELEESDWILYGEKYKQKKEAKADQVLEDTEIITRQLKNRKRKRKIRLPKNYDPNEAPDPERWLPRQERAAFKKKGKKHREREVGRGTQGASSANPNVEFSTASPNSPRPLPTPVAEGPRQMRPKNPKKKKKTSKF
ncbi:unnamed protein product [Caenorhabditis auriculariae]|uniref:Signal recognition particle subunit SRP72 n=1 Tax=Caenorhabditis auriculariae TaxID=2777116 RepID=A0A8S1HNS5_9PELO|nr:unnamed protein product [Caenorhabditis auriculariae]